MRKKHISKAQNQTFHFKKRCDERLGIQIDRKLLQRRIRTNNFDEDFYFLNRQSNRVTRYRYKFNDIWYIIPYDKNTHKVITVFEDKKQDITEEIMLIETQEQKGLIKNITEFCRNIFCIIKNNFAG